MTANKARPTGTIDNCPHCDSYMPPNGLPHLCATKIAERQKSTFPTGSYLSELTAHLATTDARKDPERANSIMRMAQGTIEGFGEAIQRPTEPEQNRFRVHFSGSGSKFEFEFFDADEKIVAGHAYSPRDVGELFEVWKQERIGAGSTKRRDHRKLFVDSEGNPPTIEKLDRALRRYMEFADTQAKIITDLTNQNCELKMATEWQPIETAPKDGTHIVCWKASWERWTVLMWKTNPRTNLSYFGDTNEMDDYELYDDQPTHWFPVSPPPEKT